MGRNPKPYKERSEEHIRKWIVKHLHGEKPLLALDLDLSELGLTQAQAPNRTVGDVLKEKALRLDENRHAEIIRYWKSKRRILNNEAQSLDEFSLETVAVLMVFMYYDFRDWKKGDYKRELRRAEDSAEKAHQHYEDLREDFTSLFGQTGLLFPNESEALDRIETAIDKLDNLWDNLTAKPFPEPRKEFFGKSSSAYENETGVVYWFIYSILKAAYDGPAVETVATEWTRQVRGLEGDKSNAVEKAREGSFTDCSWCDHAQYIFDLFREWFPDLPGK